MFNKQNVILNLEVNDKKDLFNKISKIAKDLNFGSNSKDIEKALWKRESEYSTGFENGFAIPHTRSNAINKPGFIYISLKKGIKDWPSLDSKETKYLFVLLSPEDGNKEHMKMLSNVAASLTKNEFIEGIKKSKTPTAVVKLVEKYTMSNESSVKNEKEVKENKSSLKIVGITSCAAGIAHTYIAQEKLIETGKKLGYEVHIETQGSVGVESELTEKQIKEADYVIICTDIKVNKERFVGKKLFEMPIKTAVKNPKQVFDYAISDAIVWGESEYNKQNGKSNSSKELMVDGNSVNKNYKEKKFNKYVLKHILNGISYMIPLLVAAGILLAFGKLFGSFTGDVAIADNWAELSAQGKDTAWFKFVYTINVMGIFGLWLIYPIFSMFLADSIGGRSAIVPGFLAGMIANSDQIFTRIWRTFQNADPSANPFPDSSVYPWITVSSGFFGALFGGFFAGYLVWYLNKYIKTNRTVSAAKPMLILPGISVLVTVPFMIFVINPIFGWVNTGIQVAAEAAGTAGAMVYALAIAVFTAIDLGGPINKAAGVIAIGLATDSVLPMTARTMSIVIPPIGLGLATLIDKPLTKRKLYNEDLATAGKTSTLLGFIAISEGGLPFLFEKPLLTMFSTIIGSLAGSLFAVGLGAEMWFPLPAVWGWPLVTAAENGVVQSNGAAIAVYVIGILMGAAITSLIHVYGRYFLYKKGKIDPSQLGDLTLKRKSKKNIKGAVEQTA